MLQLRQPASVRQNPAMSVNPKFIVERLDAMERVDFARRALGLSRAAFCRELGLYPPNYSKLMKAEIFLTVDQLYTLYRRYGVDPAFVLDGKTSELPVSLLEKMHALEKAQQPTE